MTRDTLADYRKKRDFASTPEPRGDAAVPADGPLTFVVQKHDARRTHYDLRIEAGGVLVSFAVPRGPSASIRDRRLAVRTEDHPLDYAAFEGIIPQGEYGGGSVIIWDAGTYAPDSPELLFHDRAAAEAAVEHGLKEGKLSLTFRGRRMKGSWTLVRTSGDWLLIKHRDQAADPPRELASFETSVLSGRTTADVARDEDIGPGRAVHYAPQSLYGRRPAPLKPVAPMLATAGRPIPATGWSYEPKLDGIRLIACLEQEEARLYSRRGNDITAAYPSLARAVAGLPASTLMLDGEIVALSARGRPSFELLQQRMNLQDAGEIQRAEQRIPVTCYVFDLLHLDGFDITAAPLEQRREALARVLLPSGPLHEVATIDLPPQEAFETAVAHGFEGIIAKRPGSRYEPGRRSDAWRKRKALSRGVFTVGGWTEGQGSRNTTFGGLLLGEPSAEGLAYRGRMGAGFTDAQARDMKARLEALKTGRSPFCTPVPVRPKPTWVRPELDVVVEYAERTGAGVLRAPVFKGLADTAAAETAGQRADGGEAQALLDQLDGTQKSLTLRGEAGTLALTNLDKELWPAAGAAPRITKRDFLRHAIRVWPFAAPHLRDRLLTFTRYPDGIAGNSFYQRHIETRKPAYIQTVRVFSETDGRDKQFVLCNNLPTLLYLCQQAALEWHTSLSRISPPGAGEDGTSTFAGSAETLRGSVLNRPDILLFDLDAYIYSGDEKPGDEPLPNARGFDAAKRGALLLREALGGIGLPSFVKTSGRTGLHVLVPIRRTLDFNAVRAFATTLGRELVHRHPDLLTTEWQSKNRTGKVFVDVNQNARSRAMVAPLSPRAQPGAPVSMPVAWEELEALPLGAFRMDNACDELSRRGWPWSNFFEAAADLRELLGLD